MSSNLSNLTTADCGTYLCPEGYTLVRGECIFIPLEGDPIIVEPTFIECCTLVENCQNPEQTYLIQLAEGQPDIYLNHVYQFNNVEQCFKVIGTEVCLERPDSINVIVTESFGLNNCLPCEPSQEFESCINPGDFVYVSVEQDIKLTEANIYQLPGINDTNCYQYIGQSNTPPQLTTEVVFLNTNDCIICNACYIFISCATNDTVIVKLLNTFDLVPNGIYNLSGNFKVESICWKFIETVNCSTVTVDFENITLANNYMCEDCKICDVKYLLIDCTDSNNQLIISWSQSKLPLNPELIYIFDFDTNTCWNIEERPPLPCGQDETSPVSVTNVINTYTTCIECNSICYKLVSCNDGQVTHFTEDSNWSIYVGKVIRWTTQSVIDSEILPIEYNCSIVESYICRTETYLTLIPVDIIIDDCSKSCEDCEPFNFIEVDEEKINTGRLVKPGYNVPDCTRTIKNCKL